MNNAVEPDLIVVLNKNNSIIKDHIHGVPDILIEILSPGNNKHDTVRKKNLYERFGVKEYWIIDPQTNEAIGFELNQNRFREIGTYHKKIVSLLLKNEFYFDS